MNLDRQKAVPISECRENEKNELWWKCAKWSSVTFEIGIFLFHVEMKSLLIFPDYGSAKWVFGTYVLHPTNSDNLHGHLSRSVLFRICLMRLCWLVVDRFINFREKESFLECAHVVAEWGKLYANSRNKLVYNCSWLARGVFVRLVCPKRVCWYFTPVPNHTLILSQHREGILCSTSLDAQVHNKSRIQKRWQGSFHF